MNAQTIKIILLMLSVAMLSGCSLPEAFKLSSKDKSESKQFGKLNNPEKFALSYARWQERQGQLDEAADSYNLALSENPNNKQAQLGLARVNMHQGNLKAAETSFKELLRTSPNDPEVLDSVAQLYAEKNEWARALALLDQAVTLKPQNDMYRYHRAVALAEFGKVPEALNDFRQVLGDSEACYNLAVVLKRKGDLQTADHFATQALNMNPKYTEASQLLDTLRSENRSRYASHSDSGYRQPTHWISSRSSKANGSLVTQFHQVRGKVTRSL
ncbi:MAG: tetratricopeptide repeat protein [Planctomycetaceae bacterium]|jgi:tetratricopeptide (TPR) repeat protein|nr:tetratricopeptide repeat protein [bacterium]MDG2389325.1 tetratricopeptide repeat protein [Planctomycetaceae bacterium]